MTENREFILKDLALIIVNVLVGVNQNTGNSTSLSQYGPCLRMLLSERASAPNFERRNVPILNEISRFFFCGGDDLNCGFLNYNTVQSCVDY